MSVLHIGIVVSLDDESWEIFHEVDVPPSYAEQDIDPFIRHEMDKAVAALQREEFGEARSAEIIAQYDRRIALIRRFLRLAPHSIRNAAVARRIREIIEMDREQLYARFGRRDTDVEG